MDSATTHTSSSSHRRTRKSRSRRRRRRVPKSHKSPQSPTSVAPTNIANNIYTVTSPPSPVLEESGFAANDISQPPERSPPSRRLDQALSPTTSAVNSSGSSISAGGATPSSGSSSSQNSSVGLAVGIVVGLAVLIVAVIAGCCLWWRRKKSRQVPSATPEQLNEASSNPGKVNLAEVQLSSSRFGPRNFSYTQLSIATKNFSTSELLGRGGFGPVYKGTLPDDGTLVAVKCISDDSSQGIKEFKAEVNIISDLRHRNLVKLRGWCHENGRFYLVYDYLHNGSLDNLLFNDEKCVVLSWSRRFSIMLGLGSALQYLHGECDSVIIHRDIKSSNVLLDENFVVKLGDFGLSRQVAQGGFAHTTLVAGTRGYMAPEVFVTGRATKESDVYGFGAVLAEVACGKRALDSSLAEQYDGMLVDWLWDLYGKGRHLGAVDERLNGFFDADQMKRVLVVALACSHPDPNSRPSIRSAMEALHGTTYLPSIPASKPKPSYGPLPPTSVEQVLGDCTTSTSATATTSSSNPFSVSSDQFVR